MRSPASSPALSTVSPAARLLGFSGLLPPLALLGLALVRPDDGWRMLAFAYAGLIFSFLGGMWWGFAVRRPASAQVPLLVAAVVPSLVAFGLLGVGLMLLDLRWPLVLLGAAILLTLPVDRHLAATGDAPEGWMALRVPLSLGLGLLTIATGVV